MPIRIELSRDEAEILVELLGDVRGRGPKREACDAVYGRLQELLIDGETPVE